ncbi:hypothetical protein SAMN05192550_1992 [Flavobacterium glycines]|uniref:Uncharacterized protein n=1 Tax=Flavobacterium glycines TaxID=551990 RepID=A0A1B9DH10_9FLAO|nr:hypothetical protein [Flavobacterium glycines]OCB68965.1 hypothetical protein FBGL_15475 [Flavobacterium glycines]GEL11166.1 hypothetical protein FGL01_19050 [Flavobacterium glycines]SDJ35857.1 hypothetical protein SAMN05192550_1992 [Flavobacterium glycines]
MNKKKAIRILEEQKQKILSSEHPNNDEWTFETASYIKDFFGFDSTEYAWISQFKWHVKYIDHPIFGNEDEADRALREKPKKAIIFLDNCIRTLNNKGLFKKSKRNFLSDKTNFELISIVFGFCVFVFWIGYWTKTVELFSLKNKAENSISFVSDTTSQKITNPKEKSTESSKYKPK